MINKIRKIKREKLRKIEIEEEEKKGEELLEIMIYIKNNYIKYFYGRNLLGVKQNIKVYNRKIKINKKFIINMPNLIYIRNR
jgi:galactokinase/mevalonate kinase-like predicted kinase